MLEANEIATEDIGAAIFSATEDITAAFPAKGARALPGFDMVLDDLKEMSGDTERIQETARLCQIDHLLHAHPADLSGGEMQRAALAKVLLTQPKLLLLDEPTKGLDSFFKQSFASILRQLCREGMTVVMVSHDVEFCAEYADVVGMFFDGQLLASNTPKKFFGSNSFYTTSAGRMSRSTFHNAVTAGDVISLLKQNGAGV